MSKSPQPIQTPGAGAKDDLTPEQVRIAELTAEVEQLRIIKAAAIARETPAGAPFEPVTVHGAEQIANSQHRHLKASELQTSIDKGEHPPLTRAVLCADGWLTPKS